MEEFHALQDEQGVIIKQIGPLLLKRVCRT